MIDDIQINSIAARYAMDLKTPIKTIYHDANTTYVGIGKIGVRLTTEKGWFIIKIYSTATTQLISLAEGNLVPDKAVDSYASYDYYPQ